MRVSTCGLVLVVVIALSCASPAHAVTKNWTAVTSGSFKDPLKWTPQGSPTSGDTAQFRVTGKAGYAVTFSPGIGKAANDSDRLVVGAGAVTFNESGGSATYEVHSATTTPSGRGIVIGELTGDVAQLNTSLSLLNAVAATLGDAPNANGALNVTAGTLALSEDTDVDSLIIGNQGSGEMTISGSGQVTTGRIVIGEESGSSGALTVDGGTLEAGRVTFGTGGNGARTINVNNDGDVNISSCFITGPTSVININHASWKYESTLSFVVSDGVHISVTDGGKLTQSPSSGSGTFVTLSNSHLLVDGSGSVWVDSLREAELHGNSTLEVRALGRVTVGRLRVSDQSILSGDAEVVTALFGVGVVNVGIVAPGVDQGTGLGTLTITGQYQQFGKLEIGIGGGLSGPIVDQLKVQGSATFGGTLEVTLMNDFEPVGGQSFQILNVTGARSGQFQTLTLPTLLYGRQWDTSELYTLGKISVLGLSALTADFQGDDDVDGDDLSLWRIGFGTTGTATHAQGDADGDHDADGVDFLHWQKQFGSGVMTTANADIVPEPRGGVMVVAAAIALWGAGRRAIC